MDKRSEDLSLPSSLSPVKVVADGACTVSKVLVVALESLLSPCPGTTVPSVAHEYSLMQRFED